MAFLTAMPVEGQMASDAESASADCCFSVSRLPGSSLEEKQHRNLECGTEKGELSMLHQWPAKKSRYFQTDLFCAAFDVSRFLSQHNVNGIVVLFTAFGD